MAALDTMQFEGQFAVLRDYFSGIQLADLDSLTNENLVQMVDKSDRALMQLYIARVLRPAEAQPVVQPKSWTVYFQSEFPYVSKEGVLLCSQNISSAALAPGPDEKTVNDLPQLLSEKDAARVHTLDLRASGLGDMDVCLVGRWVSQYFPACHTIVFAANSISGETKTGLFDVDTAIRSLLDAGITVDVTRNPIASVRRVDFFEELSARQLRKLVWISSHVVADERDWKQALGGNITPQVLDSVREAHTAYYALSIKAFVHSYRTYVAMSLQDGRNVFGTLRNYECDTLRQCVGKFVQLDGALTMTHHGPSYQVVALPYPEQLAVKEIAPFALDVGAAEALLPTHSPASLPQAQFSYNCNVVLTAVVTGLQKDIVTVSGEGDRDVVQVLWEDAVQLSEGSVRREDLRPGMQIKFVNVYCLQPQRAVVVSPLSYTVKI